MLSKEAKLVTLSDISDVIEEEDNKNVAKDRLLLPSPLFIMHCARRVCNSLKSHMTSLKSLLEPQISADFKI